MHLAVQYAIGCVDGKTFNLSPEKLLHDLKHEGQFYGLLLRFESYDIKTYTFTWGYRFIVTISDLMVVQFRMHLIETPFLSKKA